MSARVVDDGRGVKRLELVLEGGVKRVADSRLLVPMQAADVAGLPRRVCHRTMQNIER